MTRKQKKILAVSVGCIAFYTLLGFLIIPMILIRVVPDKMAEQLNRPVTIEKIRLNPYALSLTVVNLDIRDGDGAGPFVSLNELYANVQILSLFKRGLILKEVRLDTPRISVVRKSGATFNFSDLIPKGETDAEAPQETDEPSSPFHFAVSNIHIIDGTFAYRDEPYGKTHTMAAINWTVPYISNFIKDRDTYSEPALACTIDDATLTLDVKTKPFKDTMETVVDIDLAGILLPVYAAYIPRDQVGIQVNSGTLGLGVDVSFRQAGDHPSVTVQGSVSLAELDVADEEGRPILNLPRLSVSILPSDVMAGKLHVGAVHIESLTLSAVRQTDGNINLAQLVKKAPSENDPPVPPEPEQAPGEDQASEKQDGSPSPFWVDLDEFKLTDGMVGFTDHAAGTADQPVETRLKNLQITLREVSNRPDTPASFTMATALNDTAQLAFQGRFTADPVSVKCDWTVSDADLTWCQPYLPGTMALVINKGLAATSGSVDMSLPAQGTMALTVTGKTDVRDFAAVDRDKAESFLSWSDFSIDGIHVSMEPLKISVDTISFKDLGNQVVIFQDGVTNLEKIFIASDDNDTADAEAETAPAPKKEDEKVIPIRIGKVALSGTTLGFVDRSISPHFATRLTLDTLDVTGLASEGFEAATVKAQGNVNGHAPIKITGSINPLSKNPFVDIDVLLSNVEMVPFSSYTGKYIGRAIEKGKLSLGVDYLIKDKGIKAGNHLVLDQFALGKTVDSPDAMKMPVGLAIALLKDRKGVIDITMPIAGRTDDPEFKWGKAVLKALGNLITKAATAPFSLVSSIVGGGEELRYIEFQPGESSLSQTEQKKLAAIRKLLVERPGLKLDVVGYVDADGDRAALTALALERKIKAPEMMAALKNGAPDTPETIAAIVQTPEARHKALRRLYKQEILENVREGQTPKPLDDPSLTAMDMESALKDIFQVTDADLGLLAMARADEVTSALLSDETIPGERIFLKEAKTLAPPKANKFKPSRVELGLK